MMNSLFLCPKDGTALMLSQWNIAAYYCPECKGLLVDLEKTKSAPLRKLEGYLVNGKSALVCPKTRAFMLKVNIFGVEVDYSPQGRLVWLDHNEFEVITSRWLNASEYQPKSPIPDVQSEVWGWGSAAFTAGVARFMAHLF